MKLITIIGDFCYPNFAGGSSKHVFDLLVNFPKYGCEVRLLTRCRDYNSQYAASDVEAAQKYEWLKNIGGIKELKGWGLFNPFHYVRMIKGAEYVLLQHPIMGMLGGCIARVMGKRPIYHYHGPLHLEYENKTGKKGVRYHILWLFQKITVLCSSTILVHSEYMKNIAVKEHNIPDKKIKLLPPYIEEPQKFKSLSWWKNEPDKTVLLIPRRLTARTGAMDFLRQFLSLSSDEQQKYHIYVTGIGELASQVKSIADNHPNSITYLGFVTYEELWAIYGKIDAVVVPTISLEGFGYVILEAMICGSAAIVSETCGGGYDFVKEHLGTNYTFNVFDKESICKTLQFIGSKPKNRNFYRQIAVQFSPNNMIKYYLQNILQ